MIKSRSLHCAHNFLYGCHLSYAGPGCTGIIALNKEDNMVYHARNLDFQPGEEHV